MHIIRNIHRTIYNHTRKTYSFDISKFDIKNTDNDNQILQKIQALVHVEVHPQEWMILKVKDK